MAEYPFMFSHRVYGQDEGGASPTVVTLAPSGTPVLLHAVISPTQVTGGGLRILKGDGTTPYWVSNSAALPFVGVAQGPGNVLDLLLNDGLALVSSAQITAGGFLVIYARL
jgi:hypothetical protein